MSPVPNYGEVPQDLFLCIDLAGPNSIDHQGHMRKRYDHLMRPWMINTIAHSFPSPDTKFIKSSGGLYNYGNGIGQRRDYKWHNVIHWEKLGQYDLSELGLRHLCQPNMVPTVIMRSMQTFKNVSTNRMTFVFKNHYYPNSWGGYSHCQSGKITPVRVLQRNRTKRR